MKDRAWGLGHGACLKDVSFSLRRGEALGICGGNGSGKSTLLKVLANILPMTHGHIKVRGKVTIASWLDAVKAGRCQATNGPLLTLTVDDRKMGDVIELSTNQVAVCINLPEAEGAHDDERE